jgi:hypothetical protein
MGGAFYANFTAFDKPVRDTPGDIV